MAISSYDYWKHAPARRRRRLGAPPSLRFGVSGRVKRATLEDVQLALDGHAHGLVESDRAVRVQRIDPELHLCAVARRDLRERSMQQRRGDPAPTPRLDHAEHAHEPLVLVEDRDEMPDDTITRFGQEHERRVPVVGVDAFDEGLERRGTESPMVGERSLMHLVERSLVAVDESPDHHAVGWGREILSIHQRLRHREPRSDLREPTRAKEFMSRHVALGHLRPDALGTKLPPQALAPGEQRGADPVPPVVEVNEDEQIKRPALLLSPHRLAEPCDDPILIDDPRVAL